MTRRGTIVLTMLAAATVFLTADPIAADDTAPAPDHRVVAYYFHRTERCPTCRKISQYVEEAVQAGFADELADRSVALRMIDFQDAKNAQYTKYYKVTGPTLVVIDAVGGKPVQWKTLPKIWSLVHQKEKEPFFQYVQDEIRGYLEKP